MANVRIATWNINSVRLRLPIVEQFVSEHDPDVLCLQEIKVEDDKFPTEAFREMGFRYIEPMGQKSYHGVATVSKYPFEKVERMHWCGKDDSRHLVTTLEDGTEIHNFYVPAGGDEPDPVKNDKFAHKLQFLDEITAWYADRKADGNRMVLVGDLNIAPHENDVWDHKKLLKVVSHTPVEVERMARWIESHDFHDVVREFIPEDEKLYSWWSYRAKDWDAADKGRRLDHVWVTPALKGVTKSVEVLRPARGWLKPSDHVPIMADMDLPV